MTYYLLKETILAKSTNQNTRAYRLHFVDVEISAFCPLLKPGVCNRQTDRQTNKQSTITLAAHARRGLMIILIMLIA